MKDFFPTFNDLTSTDRVERIFKDVYTKVYTNREAVQSTNSTMKAELDAIRRQLTSREELQATGSTPINVTNLLGKLGEPQFASIPTVLSLPGPDDPLSQDTGVVRFDGGLWVYDESKSPGTWVRIGGFIRSGTFASRGTASTHQNEIFVCDGTDNAGRRGVTWASIYLGAVIGWQWIYISGVSYGTLADNPWKSGISWLLGDYDTGLLHRSTTHNHLHRWVDATDHFTWGPGDFGAGYIVASSSDLTVISSAEVGCTIWDFCDTDGNIDVTVKTADGTEVVVMPALCTANEIFVTAKATPDAAASVAEATKWSAALHLTDSTNLASATSGAPSATTHIHEGTEVAETTIATSDHTHDTDPDSTGHTHNLSDAAASFKPPKAGDGGVPLRYGLRWYIRL